MEKSKAIIELNTQNKLVWTNPNTSINEINVSSCLLKYSGSQIRNKKNIWLSAMKKRYKSIT